MATTSTAVSLKTQLVTSLTAALPAVQVSYGSKGDEAETDTIWIGQAQGRFEIPTMKAGRKSRDEDYTVDVWITAIDFGGSISDVETTAFSYLAELEDILADTPGLVAGTIAALVTDWECESYNLQEGAGATLKATVGVNARLN